jgi:Domain of unknown function (DUF4203)
MLPHAYELPFAILLVLSGALACFAGYRFFRVVLGTYGFLFGAMIGSSIMGVSNTVGMMVAALVGGIAGAVILIVAYFVGVALLGAGLGTLAAHSSWTALQQGDPPWQLVILASVIGAIVAIILQRYVIIVGTAFGGAWTLLVGAVAIANRGALRAASPSDAWILYPLTPAPGERWIYIVWVVLGLVGTAVQLWRKK